jgi:hypothetical protein
MDESQSKYSKENRKFYKGIKNFNDDGYVAIYYGDNFSNYVSVCVHTHLLMCNVKMQKTL